MLHQTKITGRSMTEALGKVKETLGEDAVIIATEENNDSVTLTASSTTHSEKSMPAFSVIDGGKETEDGTPLYKDALSAIRAVCDICDAHQLSYSFCEKWLKELSSDFAVTPICITRSLGTIVAFSSQWLKNPSSKEPIIVVGPPGSGKTVTLAKIAALLLSQKKKIKVLTLDTLKAGAVPQLQSYLEAMNQSLSVGDKELSNLLAECRHADNDTILLIDTPGVNIFSNEDQDFLYKLSKQTSFPLTLVLPADMNPIEAEEIAKKFHYFNTRYLITTRFDATKHYGSPLSAAHACGLQLAAFSQSPALGDGLHPLTPERMIRYLLPT